MGEGLRLRFYHGSPGTSRDAEDLAGRCAPVAVDIVRRRGYPGGGHGPAEGTAPEGAGTVMVSHSWGVVPAMRDAALAPERVAGLVAIAPYIGAERPSGALRSLLLGSFLGRGLLGLVAGGFVRKYLVKASHPKPVPASFSLVAPLLARGDVLARALLEKGEPGPTAAEAAAPLRERKIPCLILAGAADQTSGALDDARRLASMLGTDRLVVVDDGGHAIPWTHGERLAGDIVSFLRDLQGS